MTEPITAMPARTIGIDLGDRTASYCVLDEEGRVVQDSTVRMDPRAFTAEFEGWVLDVR